jgi:acyl-coenzyme A synthetase/AMP-(fatty) acid ligase
MVASIIPRLHESGAAGRFFFPTALPFFPIRARDFTQVESALKEHPAVAESAVVASPDEMRGEIVKAYVILAPGYSPSPELAAELQEHVKKVTAPYKYPREIEFVDSVPKTISGKIRRVELREMERQKKQGS